MSTEKTRPGDQTQTAELQSSGMPTRDGKESAVTGHSMFSLARCYKNRAMSAYVELQEAEFDPEANGYTATKHPREVGTGYFDRIATAPTREAPPSRLWVRPKTSFTNHFRPPLAPVSSGRYRKGLLS